MSREKNKRRELDNEAKVVLKNIRVSPQKLNLVAQMIRKETASKAISILQDQKTSKKVFDILAERYKNRSGGYTRIIKLGNRFGDNAPTAVIELVDRDENAKGLDSGPVIEKKSSEEEVEQQQQI